ncbi:MAG: hypothetical protein GTN37_02245 [Candidatus Aenigmarchaeota archaeon]|nr:hypothetical protein [Candidatus Aenigmarchaeota archaeon]
MENWQKGLGLGGLIGLYFAGKKLANVYLDGKLKKAGFYPVPEGTSILQKIKLISKSPYNKIQI